MRKIKKELIETCKYLEQKGYINAVDGNVSIKVNDRIFITPSKMRKSSLKPRDIAILDLTGKQVAGSKTASSEALLHIKSYQLRADISAVVHAHPTFLTAHAICGKPVKTDAFAEMIAVFKEIKVAAYGRPGTTHIFDGVAPILATDNAVLLGNHGTMVVGEDLQTAVNLLEAAETSTKSLLVATLVGEPKPIAKEELVFLKTVKY